MDRQLWLHQLITEELERSEELYHLFATELKTLPKGSLLNRNGHMYRAFREKGVQYQKPINNNFELLQAIKLRQFIRKSMLPLKRKIMLCRQFLERECFYDPIKIEACMREIYHQINDKRIFLKGDITESMWKAEDYERNEFPFQEEHLTDGGVQVRSKAEAMIGTQMEHRGMIFRCEPVIKIGTRKAYPDFEIFLPRRRRRVYLEHFGKMDSPEYFRKAMAKLKSYYRAGLILGVNFFFTWETQEKPLNIKEINEVLDEIKALDNWEQ